MAARKSAVTVSESPLASTQSLVPKLASVGQSAKRLGGLSRNVGKLCRICSARGSPFFLSHIHSGLNQQDPVSWDVSWARSVQCVDGRLWFSASCLASCPGLAVGCSHHFWSSTQFSASEWCLGISVGGDDDEEEMVFADTLLLHELECFFHRWWTLSCPSDSLLLHELECFFQRWWTSSCPTDSLLLQELECFFWRWWTSSCPTDSLLLQELECFFRRWWTSSCPTDSLLLNKSECFFQRWTSLCPGDSLLLNELECFFQRWWTLSCPMTWGRILYSTKPRARWWRWPVDCTQLRSKFLRLVQRNIP